MVDSSPRQAAAAVVVMGVSGSGKTTVAKLLAERVGFQFIEADDLHSDKNVDLMAAGIPLTDADRLPWLVTVRDAISNARHEGRGTIVACSALKESYREILRSASPDVRFLWCFLPQEALARRLTARAGHFMPPSLLQSQIHTLEPLTQNELREGNFAVDGTSDLDTIVSTAVEGFRMVPAIAAVCPAQRLAEFGALLDRSSTTY